MSCVFKGTPGNVWSTGLALLGSTICVFTSNLREGGGEAGAEPRPGRRRPGSPCRRSRGSHLQKLCPLKSSALPPPRGTAPVTRATSGPKPSLSRRLGPSTDAPVYTHTWRPAGDKGRMGLGAGRGRALSSNVERENPGSPVGACRARGLRARKQPLPMTVPGLGGEGT